MGLFFPLNTPIWFLVDMAGTLWRLLSFTAIFSHVPRFDLVTLGPSCRDPITSSVDLRAGSSSHLALFRLVSRAEEAVWFVWGVKTGLTGIVCFLWSTPLTESMRACRLWGFLWKTLAELTLWLCVWRDEYTLTFILSFPLPLPSSSFINWIILFFFFF